MEDTSNAIKHLQTHMDYPATKEELVAAFDDLSDFSDMDKEWFGENLPEGVYDSADNVIQALGWGDESVQMY
jgi:hypothetical protein